MKRGYNVLTPLVTTRYDLAVETSPGVLCRVQVKTASIDKHGNLNVSSSKTPYSSDEVDVIAVYDATHDHVYYVPIGCIDGVLYSLRLTERRIRRLKGAALMARDFTEFPINGGTYVAK